MKLINSIFYNRYYSYFNFSNFDDFQIITFLNAIGNYWNPSKDKSLKILLGCNTQFLQSKVGLIASILNLSKIDVFQSQFTHGRNFQLDLFALEALDNTQNFDYFFYIQQSDNKFRLYIWDNHFEGLLKSDWENIIKLINPNSTPTQLQKIEVNLFKSSAIKNLKKYFLLNSEENSRILKIGFLQDRKKLFSWKGIDLELNFDFKTILNYDFFVKLTKVFWLKKLNTLIDANFNIFSKTNKNFEKISWTESLFLIIYYYLFVIKTEKRILIISEINFEFLADMNEKIIYNNTNPNFIDLNKFICLFVSIDGNISFLPQTNLYKSNIIYTLLMLEILNYFSSQKKDLLDLNRIISKWKPIPFVEVIKFKNSKSIAQIRNKILKINGITTEQEEFKILENQDKVIEFKFKTENNKIFLVYNNVSDVFYISIFILNGDIKLNKLVKKIKRKIK